jgi:signal peptidase I
MSTALSVPGARAAFWIAIVVGVLTLAAVFSNPVEALVAAPYLLAAWGIRRGNAWAAAALACLFAAAPAILLVHAAQHTADPSVTAVAMASAIGLALAYYPARAAAEWFRRGAPRGRAWPWAVMLLALGWLAFGFWPYLINGGSMEDTLLRGDYLLVETASWNLGRAPRFGDMVACRLPIGRKQVFVKRVVGLPGDRLRIVDKQLYRNGAAVVEPYAVHKSASMEPFRDNFPGEAPVEMLEPGLNMLREDVRGGEVVVPPGKYFVLGDNRDDSLDSRYFGCISRADILGSPVVIYGSFDSWAQIPKVWHMRWNRFLRRV